ncbi:class I SAM-dependent DNA methyltransferase [Bradyrhizobium sp. vgs-9]|uniref:class I SAM-dependent DNA methyltransferase n=1 Tax=Bradyrhizobium sp. vgs-9 TaxID=208389 RepID=UPI0035D42DB3
MILNTIRGEAMQDKNKRKAFVERARDISIRHFADTAATYDTAYGTISPMHAESVREFLILLGPDAAVLDAACGTGVYFEMLLQHASRLFGIDQSEAMLSEARQKWPEVKTRCLALQHLQFCEEFAGAFQGVVCINALEWVLRDDWAAVLAGFRHVLSAGGLLYVTIEIPGEDERRALAQGPEEGAEAGEVAVHYWYNHFPAVDDVLAWAAQHGFRKEAHRHCAYYHHLLLRLT